MTGHRSRLDLLTGELRRHVVRRGLPVRVPKEFSPIFDLHCVAAHATSDDLLDRAAALDGIIRRILISHFGGGPDGDVADVLFALVKGTKGATLTKRRERCAELRGVHVDHWRKHLEPRLLEAVAHELHLLDRIYKPRLAETVGHGVPDLGTVEEETAEAYARHEVQARIVTFMFGYRAELLATYRAARFDETLDLDEHIDLALWEYTNLVMAIRSYVEQHGHRLVFLESDATADTALRVAGWHPPFTQREVNWLGITLVRVSENRARQFTADLKSTQDGRNIHEKWSRLLKTAAQRVPAR